MKCKLLLLFVLFLTSFSSLQAQVIDCDCEFVEGEYVCAIDSLGVIIPVPNDCFAECYGLEVVDEACENPWDGWEPECDCPAEDWLNEGFCIEVNDIGGTDSLELFQVWVPSDCLAVCWGFEDYTIVDCDWGWEPECDCPDEDWSGEGFCIEFADPANPDSLNVWQEWVPSECIATCWGYENYTIVDCDWGWEPECDCPDEDWIGEGFCIEITDPASPDSLNVWQEWVPSECIATCWGYENYTIVDCDWGWEPECDCPDEDWAGEGFCIEISDPENPDSIGVWQEWVPSECIATCWGYENYTIVDCDWGWEPDCECPEEDWTAEGFCIEVLDPNSPDSTNVWQEWVPSDCVAQCFGYEDYTIVDCDWGWEPECECPEEDWESEGICIEVMDPNDPDSTNIWQEWVPSECLALCWGYENFTILDDCDFGWESDCDCEDGDDEGICIESNYGGETYIDWVPSICYADCWGYTEYTVVDCPEYDYPDGGEYTALDSCLVYLEEEGFTTLQNFILDLHECGAIEVDACTLAAPIFETDEEFLEYILEYCDLDIDGGFANDSDSPSIINIFKGVSAEAAGTTAVDDLRSDLSISLLQNPVSSILRVNVDSDVNEKSRLNVYNFQGILMESQALQLNQGNQMIEIDVEDYQSGAYLIKLGNAKALKTLKFIVQK